ncbi:MAG TPA: L,D-transpeptidase family protein [Thermoanaerobaculia bacterium]|nr:L,D-transpeptidase family protein [Thermoanaerobaculia bacterium]
MPRWVGLLGSWALFVLAIGLASFAVAGEWINFKDDRRLERVVMIDKMIAARTGARTDRLRETAQQRTVELNQLQSKVADAARQTDDVPDTGQTILVSTEENKVYVRQNGQTIFEAVCSTGKGTTLAVDGRTLVFDTPIGKFHVKSKEENPQWVPPDWHYVELARKEGMRVVRLNPGGSIDASTGQPGGKRESGVWSWFGGGSSSPTLRLRGNTVVKDYGDHVEELPPGKVIVAGDAVVIPPVDSPQRHFDKVLGLYRLNLGDGYALHGTQETAKLGQAVSHGCVRLGDDDIARLYAMSQVGDQVIIY